MQQEVAKFLFQFVVTLRLVGVLAYGHDGLAEFVDFLDAEVAKRLDGLLAVPRTLAAQTVENVAEALEGLLLGGDCGFGHRCGTIYV